MREELEQLLELEWAGGLDEAGRARLESLASADPVLAGRLRQERHLSAMLRRCGPNPAPAALSRAVLRQLNLPAEKPGLLERLFPRLGPAWAYGLAAVAVLALGGLAVQRHESDFPLILATVDEPAALRPERQLARAVPEPTPTPNPGAAKPVRERAVLPPVGDLQALAAPAVAPPPARTAESAGAPAAPAASDQLAAADRAEPVPSPTPAPSTLEPEPAQPVEEAQVAQNDPRRLPEKMRARAALPAEPSGPAAPAAGAAAAAAAAAPETPTEVEVEIQMAALAATPVSEPPPAAARPAGPPKMRVLQDALSGGGAVAPGELSVNSFAAGQAPAEANPLPPEAGQAAPPALVRRQLESVLTSLGAQNLAATPVGGAADRAWRVTATLPRGQLRQFMQELKGMGIEPIHAPGTPRGHYTVRQGEDALSLGHSLHAAQQPVRLSLLVRE